MDNYVSIYHECDLSQLDQLKQAVNRAIDAEEIPATVSFPVTVQFELMAECNLSCLHCYNRSGDHDLDTAMKIEEWLNFSQHLVDNGGIFQCILSGGEPLLMGKERLPRIMDILHADGTSFVLITNGFLLDQEWVDILSRYRFYWVQVSIDGVNASIHDQFRGVEGSWKRAVEGAFLVSKAGLPLVIAHTVTPQNLEGVSQMVDLVYQLGATAIILGEVLPSGRAYENGFLILSIEQRNQLYCTIEELAVKYRGRMEVQRSSGVHYQLNRYRITPNMGCIIRPNGDVRMDCMAPFVIGNVLQQSFADIWKEKGANCWNDPAVLDYIASIDPITNFSDLHHNHAEVDTKI